MMQSICVAKLCVCVFSLSHSTSSRFVRLPIVFIYVYCISTYTKPMLTYKHEGR